jgi:tetratricopeptide (TPR) repeat protein
MKKLEKDEIVMEAAKLHYNIGNFYYRHQQYDFAAEEYRKSLLYAPDEADTHFNLAVVMDEHLRDRQTAVHHYKRYLALNPEDESAVDIEDRILNLELYHRVVSGSPFDIYEEDLDQGAAHLHSL